MRDTEHLHVILQARAESRMAYVEPKKTEFRYACKHQPNWHRFKIKTLALFVELRKVKTFPNLSLI